MSINHIIEVDAKVSEIWFAQHIDIASFEHLDHFLKKVGFTRDEKIYFLDKSLIPYENQHGDKIQVFYKGTYYLMFCENSSKNSLSNILEGLDDINILERQKPIAKTEAIYLGNYAIFFNGSIFYKGNKSKNSLSPAEYEIFSLLCNESDKILSAKEIINKLGIKSSPSTIISQIKNIRKKFYEIDQEIIKNIRGKGYLIEPYLEVYILKFHP